MVSPPAGACIPFIHDLQHIAGPSRVIHRVANEYTFCRTHVKFHIHLIPVRGVCDMPKGLKVTKNPIGLTSTPNQRCEGHLPDPVVANFSQSW